MSLKRALVLLFALVLAVGTIPAGFFASNRLGRALRQEVTASLEMAPELLRTRWTSTVDVRMMHARDVARTPGLAEALVDGESSAAARIVEEAGAEFPESPLLVGANGQPIIAPDTVPAALLEATRRGEMPVGVVSGSGRVRVVSLAPVESNGEWVGAAGGTSNLDQGEAATLAVLSRSQVLILDADGNVVGSSVPEEETAELAYAVNAAGITVAPVPEAAPTIREITVGQTPYLATRTQIADASSVVFLKNLENELAVLPRLRRIALLSAAFTLGLALVLGGLFGARLARPVGSLADAADRLSSGDFEAPLEPSGISEVTRVSVAFDEMRKALKARLAELEHVNKELEDRQERLMVLQAELVQRDRLASAGRLLSQLAHEIRNPIAGIRNCLEVVRRRADDDAEAQRFADMAIDELLRMHELTEQMLDVHRPRDPKGSACAVNEIAREVATLLKAGTEPGKQLSISVVSRDGATARVAPDSLKQVLLNLGLNAREAMQDEGPIEIVTSSGDGQVTIEVLDRGPGIDEDILSRIFDPFFTTKEQVQGVGLGLFTAEAIVRTYGGRIAASNRTDGPGARFTVQLPEAEVVTSETDTDGRSG